VALLVALVSASFLGLGCGSQADSQSAPSSTSALLALTERDDGRTVTMRLGRTGVLRHPSRLRGEVKASGAAVSAYPIETFAPTETREWALTARRVGTSVLTGPSRDGSRFRITIRVVRGG
jgi:hypothetical protein